MKKLHKRNSLSTERIRKCEKFKNTTDEQALEVIHSLEWLALILYEHWRNHEVKKTENQRQKPLDTNFQQEYSQVGTYL